MTEDLLTVCVLVLVSRVCVCVKLLHPSVVEARLYSLLLPSFPTLFDSCHVPCPLYRTRVHLTHYLLQIE